ncbi:E3 ubiquitin/ISG15 ligase TRIM25-like [Xenopus laevis]|uniref:E3 ubiquitin/ISG15 ligase TRIM25-like n=2 Tax=Xenopus laevis TaxID=8355 RepID=A0A8J1LU03_XENLA|nr:E3 ubiquitin/ISG15 ligase TRIM25-like [Xenopus laevis]
MAAVDVREELSCSICLSIYTDPVMLPCGHNFCQDCIGKVLDTQEGSGSYTCPECREEYQERPALHRNRTLGNIAEKFLPTQPEPGETEILCTYCDSPVPAVKSCEQCETSLCDTHLHKHNKSIQHTLTEPTCSFNNRKCSIHSEFLRYYCCEDDVCVCGSCCLAGEHRGHRVELLSEASEKKKEKLRKVLGKLSQKKEKTKRRVQRLQEHRREVAEKAAGETERVTDLFKEIREQLEALEKRLLSDISSQKEKLSLQLSDQIKQLEIMKDELSQKIRHIEELSNMADPLTVLQERESHGAAFCGTEDTNCHFDVNVGEEDDDNVDEESDVEVEENYSDKENTDYEAEGKCDKEDKGEEADNEDRERDDIKVPDTGNLNKGLISETLLTGLAAIVTGVKGRIYGQEATDLLLDINTAHRCVALSEDRKTATWSETDICYPNTPERFIEYSQVLSSRSFPSGRHYWEVEGSKSGDWDIGVAYPSIKREGDESGIGNNIHSWSLSKCGDAFTMLHNSVKTPVSPTCEKFRISLDYEAGLLSFYELSKPIRHLHTFTASFTEPLYPAFYVYDKGWVRICN